MRLRLLQTLVCKICQRDIVGEERRTTAINVMLFGHTRFALCFCGQEAGEELMEDRHYRIRWNRELRWRQANGGRR